MKTRHPAGMTLTEMLVAAGIVASCVAVAVPGYRSHLIRAHRLEAIAALTQLRVAQEKRFLRDGRYASDVSSASEVAHYDLDMTVAEDGLSYTAVARRRPGGVQIDDTQCLDFTIDEQGTRGVSGPAGPEACWK